MIRGEADQMAAMRDGLEQGILERGEEAGVNGEGAARVPNTSSIRFDCIEGEALVIALDLKGLAVSTGAACSSGAIEPSHVLRAMGLRPDQAQQAFASASASKPNLKTLDSRLELIPDRVTRLRELSPVYKKEASSFKLSATGSC